MSTPTFDIYVRDAGQRHRIHFSGQTALKRGGAGSVWRMPVGRFAGSVAKLYHDPKQSANRAKLEAMLARPPNDVYLTVGGKRLVQFAWPTYLVEDGAGQCVGFLMPEVDGNAPRLLVYNEMREAQNRLSPEQRSLHGRVLVAANVATLMASLHGLGHSFVDVKDENVLIYPDVGSSAFIDCDGFRIDDGRGRVFPAELATPEYSSPEYARGAHPEQLGEAHDRFALAIILFKLLNYGIHPFQGRPVSQRLLNKNSFGTVDCIADGLYPYGARRNAEIEPMRRSIHETWDTRTRALFDRAFASERPEDRPKASEWARHLRTIITEKGLSRCDQAPQDVEHLHFANRPCHVCSIFLAPSTAANPPVTGAGQRSGVSAGASTRGGVSRGPAIGASKPPPTGAGAPVGASTSARSLPPVPASKPSSGIGWIVVLAAIIALAFFGVNSKGSGTVGSSSPTTAIPTASAPVPTLPAQPLFGPDAPSALVEASPAFRNAESILAGDSLGDAFTKTAGVEIERTLRLASVDDLAELRGSAIAVNRSTPVPSINGVSDTDQLAARFNQAAKRYFWDVRDSAGAVRMAKVAFGYEPTNREYASNLAQFLVEARDIKAGFRVLVLSTVLARPDNAAPRIQDWETLATIAHLIDEPSAAESALYVAYAVAGNVKTRCESMLRYPKTRPLLEAAAKAVFARIQQRMAQGDAPFEAACTEPLQWERP